MSTRLEGKADFIPPIAKEEDFGLAVLQKQVRLEMVIIGTGTVTGYVRVANLSDDKRVTVRFTLDKGENYSEVEAKWIKNVEDGNRKMKKFLFSLPAPHQPGELSFAVHYNDHWDNNEEKYYTVLFERV